MDHNVKKYIPFGVRRSALEIVNIDNAQVYFVTIALCQPGGTAMIFERGLQGEMEDSFVQLTVEFTKFG